MQPFVLNRHDRIVFPSNFFPELDLSVIHSLEQLDRVIRRDFEVKAPSGTDILHRVEQGAYSTRYDLMRDLALNLFWTNRFSMTLYEKRPTRWADVPRTRADVFMPIVTPWVDGDRKVAAVLGAYEALPPTWNREVEDRISTTVGLMVGRSVAWCLRWPNTSKSILKMRSSTSRFQVGSSDS